MFQINRLNESVADCPRLKVLRLEENCLELTAFTPRLLRDSKVALLAIDGNVFDQKTFRTLEGYDEVRHAFIYFCFLMVERNYIAVAGALNCTGVFSYK